MSRWSAYKIGQSVGSAGADSDMILRDEEHASGARITLKRVGSYISITCDVYGWINHTRFFESAPEAQREYALMKSSLGNIVENVLSADQNKLKIWEAITEFVRRFP
jgi:hypothetical protein